MPLGFAGQLSINTFTRGEEIVNLLLTDLLKNILFSV